MPIRNGRHFLLFRSEMSRLSVALLSFLLIACSADNNTQEGTDTLKTVEITASDCTTVESIPIIDSTPTINTETVFLDTSGFPIYFNTTNPVIFSDTAYVYEKRDTSSVVIAKLCFNTPIEIINPDSYWFGWYEIKIGDIIGCVRTSVVATHKFISHPKFHYFLLNSYSPEYNPTTNGFTIYKFNVRQQQFVDTFTVTETRADLVKELNHVAWKNTDFLLYTWQVDAYCGGSHPQLYIIDANNNFEQLFYTYNHMDDGEEGGSSCASVKFPKNVETDSIVFHEFREVAVQNKNGRSLKNPDGSYKMKIVDDTTRYYRWDGKTMRNVGTEVNNN